MLLASPPISDSTKASSFTITTLLCSSIIQQENWPSLCWQMLVSARSLSLLPICRKLFTRSALSVCLVNGNFSSKVRYQGLHLITKRCMSLLYSIIYRVSKTKCCCRIAAVLTHSKHQNKGTKNRFVWIHRKCRDINL